MSAVASVTRRSTRWRPRTRHAEELGQLAEALGRQVEARGWSLDPRGAEPSREDLRLASGPSGPGGPASAAALMEGSGGWRREMSAPATDRNGTSPARRGHLRGSGRAAGLRFLPRQRPHPQEPAAARDDVRGRRPARLRRRRLARCLRRPGRAVPPRRIDVPRTATGSSATAAAAGSRTRSRRSGIADFPAGTATAWPSATTTTTAGPTCSSPAGDRMPSTATAATGRSRT